MPARDDPFTAFNFQIDFGFAPADTLRGGFREVSGLDAEIAQISYRTGTETTTVRKLPGLVTYSNIVLKRGLVSDLAFWNWTKGVINGQVNRVNGTITMLDATRSPVLRFTVRNAWPCRWTGPSLDAQANTVALETLEICHEGFEVA